MAVTVPTVFEGNLALGDGTKGFSLSKALQLDQEVVPNLYSIAGNVFTFNFQEHGVAYNETEPTSRSAQVSFEVQQGSPSFTLTVNPSPVQKWGINFAGSIVVKHNGGTERVIYLPGTRTYDPAGLTGDPHASERIGPSCSRSQVAVSIAQVVAAQNGAESSHLSSIQQATLPLVNRYHGRQFLFEWMKLQIKEAVYGNKDVTPYPEFIKKAILEGRLELTDARQHTRAYLNSYNRGQAQPPIQYYQKVAKKDKVSGIFSADDLAKFNKLVQST